MDAPTVLAELIAAFVARNMLTLFALAAMGGVAIKVVVPLASVMLAGVLAGRVMEPFQRRAVRKAMLAEGLCPGCAYDLLSTDPDEGRAVCPECGAGWELPERESVGAEPVCA